MDFHKPLPHLIIVSNDGQKFYYPSHKLARSCKFFRDAAISYDAVYESPNHKSLPLPPLENVVLFENQEFTFDFPGDVIKEVLYFIEHETFHIKDLDTILEMIKFADLLDFDEAGYYADKHLIVTQFLGVVMKNLDINIEYGYEFVKSKNINPDEWLAIHYALTHLDEWKEFAKTYVHRAPPPCESGSNRILKSLSLWVTSDKDSHTFPTFYPSSSSDEMGFDLFG